MQSIGEKLKHAREAKGLTLQQVEEETNMRWKYIEALEAENFDVIPGKAYIKGFLRNYSAFLGLDCDAIINQYRQLYEVSAEAKERIGENEVRKKNQASKRRIKWPLVAGYAVLALGLVYLATTFTTDGQPEVKQPEPTEIVQEEPKITPEPKVTEPPAPEEPKEPETQGASNVELNQAGEIEIKLQASDGKSWLKVMVDDEKAYEGFIENQTQTYKAKSKIGIRLGNAGAVSIVANGQNVGKLGEVGQVVNWEFTK